MALTGAGLAAFMRPLRQVSLSSTQGSARGVPDPSFRNSQNISFTKILTPTLALNYLVTTGLSLS